MPQYAIGIDIGGTQTRLGLCTAQGEISRRIQMPTLQEPQEMLPQLGEAVHRCCEAEKLPLRDLAGVGCSMAGTISRGIVGKAPNLPKWQGISLADELGKAFPDLPLVVENDANAAAWAILCFEAPQLKHFLYVTVSTGIGGGIVTGGKLYHGKEGNAGEVGHIIVDPDGPRCGCGKRGCWEAFASGTAIRRRARELGLSEPTAEAVFQRAARGDPESQKIVEEAAFYLGVGLASLAEVFDPEAIFLGGGLINSWEQLQTKVLQAFRQHSRWETPIRLTRLGEDIGLLGAAALVFYNPFLAI